MSQQSASNMAQAPAPSSASPAATLPDNASSRKRKVDEIEDKSPDQTSPDEMTDNTAVDTSADVQNQPDGRVSKKLQIFAPNAPIKDIRKEARLKLIWAPDTYKLGIVEWFVEYATEHLHFPSRIEEAAWIKERKNKPVNVLQALRKQKRDEKVAKKGTGVYEYVKSSRKTRLDPHQPHVQEGEQDDMMVDRERMDVQQVLMQQAGGAPNPVTGDEDADMDNAQSAADRDAAGSAADPSSSGTPVSNGASTVQPAPATPQSFNQVLPPLYTPWNLGHVQPRARYAQNMSCPVNRAAFSELEDADWDAYVLREPWNPKPSSWEAAVQAYMDNNGGKANAKITSSEGLRKRFKRANRAIFDKEGVYFYMSSLGLEDYGIPVDNTLAALEKAANNPDADPDKKNTKKAEPPVLARQGASPLTIQKLLGFYYRAKAVATRDMILDKIYRVLQNEKSLHAKYGGNGTVYDGDIHEAVRLLDLEPSYFGEGSFTDPLGELLADIFLHGVDVEEARRLRENALRSDHGAEELYEDFAQNRGQAGIESFVDAVSPELFCEIYHQHHKHNEECYRKRPRKEYKPFPHIFRSLTVNNVWGYTIENKTAIPFNMQECMAEERKWDWERVKSVSYHIQLPTYGPQKRVRAPEYYRPEERDRNGRYPSHPHYEVFEGGPISALESWHREAFGDQSTKAKFAKFKENMFTRDTKYNQTTWEEDGWGKPFGAQ